MWKIIGIILIIINCIDFILCGIDKYKATHHRWRIPEKVLLGLGLVGGCLGLFIGMLLFHHKVSKPSFFIPAILELGLWSFILYKIV